MKILICEDEAPSSRLLLNTIKSLRNDVQILGIVETGEEAVDIISSTNLDLIFLDVELADGSCFKTFSGIEINTPIIFTTAYDEYALNAFQLNSIDYLIKPISEQAVDNALKKYERFRQEIGSKVPFKFRQDFLGLEGYKEKFLVKSGRKLYPIKSSDIAYFIAKDKLVWLVTCDQKKFIIDYTLSELEEALNPVQFFRLNRQFYCHLQGIKELESYFKGQVQVFLNPKIDEEVIVSRSKTPELKKWLNR